MMNEQSANAQETLNHLKAIYEKYGQTMVLNWKTSEGKWIDSTVLEALAADGKVRKVYPKVTCMWTSRQYHYIPEGAKASPLPEPPSLDDLLKQEAATEAYLRSLGMTDMRCDRPNHSDR